VTQYYWRGKQGIAYHTDLSNGELDVVDPFFDSVEAAESYLERQNENTGNGTYEDMVLYDTGGRRIEEAVEVLTDQSGFTDFL
jgi:hypothetical protein